MSTTQEQVETRQETGRNKGFTLIELLIVIAILGILSVVVVLSVGGTTTTAKSKACVADKQTVLIAAEAYNASTGSYPADMAAIVAGKYLQAASTSYSFTSTDGVTYVIAPLTQSATVNTNKCT